MRRKQFQHQGKAFALYVGARTVMITVYETDQRVDLQVSFITQISQSSEEKPRDN